jgi:hypothetical protein
MMKKSLFLWLVLTLVAFALIAGGGGCGGGSDGADDVNVIGGGGDDDDVINPVAFESGEDVIVTTQIIGEAGGTIEAGVTDAPIDGISVRFPAGALLSDTSVSLGYNSGTLTPNEGSYYGVNLVLNVDDVPEFNFPVEICTPLPNTYETPIPFYIDDEGRLNPCETTDIDREKGTFTFVTLHASTYSCIFYVDSEGKISTSNNILHTGFSPKNDGFQVENNGSIYNPGGECFGMSSFSLWYFKNIKESKGAFYPKYMDVVGKSANGNNVKGQDIIATRSHLSMDQLSGFKYLHEDGEYSDISRFTKIIKAMINSGPVLLDLYYPGEASGFWDWLGVWDSANKKIAGHTVLAYAYKVSDDGTTGEISIYDPDRPGEERKILFESGKFKPYDSSWVYGNPEYKLVFLGGDGTYVAEHQREKFQNILDDADANFHNNAGAVIKITSHKNGEHVSANAITFTGEIESGEILVKKISVFEKTENKSLLGELEVGEDGKFSFDNLILREGENHLFFEVEGNRGKSGKGLLPNNMTTEDFVIYCDAEKSIIRVTLQWNTNNTDVDLYVIDPSGDYSYYHHKETADGGVLDVDDVDGLGPENWTLKTTDTIRYGEPYKVRVHYYEDNGVGSSNYLVNIKLYEGTEREYNFPTFKGNLAVSNYENDAPSANGPDWRNITSVVLTKSESASEVSATTLRDGMINITIPVPSYEDRAKNKN